MEKAAGIAKLLLWIALHQTDEFGVQMDETVIFHGLVLVYTSLDGKRTLQQALNTFYQASHGLANGFTIEPMMP